MNGRYWRSALLGTLAALALMACGGGGDTASPTPGTQPPTTAPAAPSLTWQPKEVKEFAFSWASVSGTSEYRLLEDPDGVSGYLEVARIASSATTYTLENVSLVGRINARYLLEACNTVGCTRSVPVYVGDAMGAVGYLKASNTNDADTNYYDYFGHALAISGDGNTLAVGAYLEDSSATGIGGDQYNSAALYSGAVYVFTRNGSQWSQQAYVKASNTEFEDYFGHALALSKDGNTLAVGAYTEDSNATGVGGNQMLNTAGQSGAVYVFTRSGTAWSQQAYVKAANTGAGDYFGIALALSGDGNLLAVGATREDSSATGIGGDDQDNTAVNSGAVYVFARNGGSWAQQAYVKASNADAGDGFGSALALSNNGDIMAVGARGEDGNSTGIGGDETDNSAPSSGAVYLFTRSNTTWTQQAYVKASNLEDYFGASLAISGDGATLAASAFQKANDAGEAGNSANNSGAVYIFARSESTWTQQAYLKASSTEGHDEFGSALALTYDGSVLAVGARMEESNAIGIGGNEADNSATGCGAVYQFRRSDGAWTPEAYVKAINTEGSDWFGAALGLSEDGGTLAVGANGEDSRATGIGGDPYNNSASDSGAAFLF